MDLNYTSGPLSVWGVQRWIRQAYRNAFQSPCTRINRQVQQEFQLVRIGSLWLYYRERLVGFIAAAANFPLPQPRMGGVVVADLHSV